MSFALAEALDHLDEVEGLDEEARRRLDAFCEELRSCARPPVGPCSTWSRPSWSAPASGPSWRRPGPPGGHRLQNLATFLDRVAAFAPVQGDPSLAAFLVYLDAGRGRLRAGRGGAAGPGRLGQADDRAHGQGPGVPDGGGGRPVGWHRQGRFPQVRDLPGRQGRRPRRAQGFLYELREDAGHLPRFTGNAKAFRGELEQAFEDERRPVYVAITRAKQLLVLTSAWWYQGSEKILKGPGPFWTEAAGHPAVEVLVQAEQPAASPLTERLRERALAPSRPPSRGPGRPGVRRGPRRGGGAGAGRPGDAGGLGPAGSGRRLRRRRAGHHLLDAAWVDPTPARTEPPRILSVIQVLDYARRPRDFYWSVVRPPPSAPKPAARLGSVVHRLLERRARNLPDLLETDELADDRPGGHLASS